MREWHHRRVYSLARIRIGVEIEITIVKTIGNFFHQFCIA